MSFNEQQLQVLDRIKCPITRQIMENLMLRAKGTPVDGETVRPMSKAQKAKSRR